MIAAPALPGPVLDEHMVSSLRDFGHEPGRLLQEMVRDFLTEAPALMAEIEQAAVAGDLRTAARVAHQMKGLAGHMGAVRVASAASTIETLAKSGLRHATSSATATARAEVELALVAARALQ